MWEVITEERSRRCIVLTTHSMEEAEALCSRIAIMAAGRLQCLGGQQHLKSKYGGGYASRRLRCAPPRVAAARAAVARLFEGAREVEHHAGKLKFELPSEKDGGVASPASSRRSRRRRRSCSSKTAGVAADDRGHLPQDCGREGPRGGGARDGGAGGGAGAGAGGGGGGDDASFGRDEGGGGDADAGPGGSADGVIFEC